MNRVAEFRETLKWSRKALAESARLSETAIWLIEKDRATPRLLTMKRISTALGHSLSEVFPEFVISPPRKTRKVKSEICKWCGQSYVYETHAALVVGGRVVKEYGHEKCLKEYICTEKF